MSQLELLDEITEIIRREIYSSFHIKENEIFNPFQCNFSLKSIYTLSSEIKEKLDKVCSVKWKNIFIAPDGPDEFCIDKFGVNSSLCIEQCFDIIIEALTFFNI